MLFQGHDFNISQLGHIHGIWQFEPHGNKFCVTTAVRYLLKSTKFILDATTRTEFRLRPFDLSKQTRFSTHQ